MTNECILQTKNFKNMFELFDMKDASKAMIEPQGLDKFLEMLGLRFAMFQVQTMSLIILQIQIKFLPFPVSQKLIFQSLLNTVK